MKQSLIKNLVLPVFFILAGKIISAQGVYPLVPGISIDSILLTQPGATKIAMDLISAHLFYSTDNGNIYEVYIPAAGTATDSLRYTVADHGISSLQGLCIRDSVMYLCGDIWSSTTGVLKIVKGTLQPNGTRIWVDVATTVTYPRGINGDHGFTGVNVDPAGNYIYVSSGSRTMFGGVQTAGGTWPGYREVPLTSRIFRFPVNSVGIILPNDSSLLDNSGYTFAKGNRNAYDMAWDGNDTLFAIDNSGERDDPEELNWLREGKHYGFPWRMGGNDNPLRNYPYDVNQDPLVNHLCGGYLQGLFAPDSTFPDPPPGLLFQEPIRNYGTAADFYRDTITGAVHKASDSASYIATFTAHRSPLGLVFDRDSMLAAPFRGDGFVLCYMPGGDSTGYTPLSPWGSPCPFVDTCRDLIQMKLIYNLSIDNYTMTTSRIAEGFYLPVDAVLVDSVMYVIENNGNIWRITFPSYVGIPEIQEKTSQLLFPNPFNQRTTLKFENSKKENCTLTIFNTFGQIVRRITRITSTEIEIERQNLTCGFYYFQLQAAKEIRATGKLIIY